MDIDKTTFEDLSIFHSEEDASVFHKLNFTQTTGGRQWLHNYFLHPFGNLNQIRETQHIIGLILGNEKSWPQSITNGTIMVIEKFYDTPLDAVPFPAQFFNAYGYKYFHAADYGIIKFSVKHFADFCRGMHQLQKLGEKNDSPPLLNSLLRRSAFLLTHPIIQSLIQKNPEAQFSVNEICHYGGHLQRHFKQYALELIEIYGRFDAWYSMAMSTRHYDLAMPYFREGDRPFLESEKLYHPLVESAVSYDIGLGPEHSFIFLTGANMAGKSTFIKAIGIAVYLAHLGMGVPAKNMELSLFEGIISNINVVDNIAKGESYFYNEVQRIKNTILKIDNPDKWLVLIDELFKGTNVQDAMKCSATVIRGLIKIKNSLFILSTHLYEIGEELRVFPNIVFRYFETNVHNDQLEFSYQMKEGISNDRLGYLILKREKVVELLDRL
jgi:DNA mismatch repair ATPase MutS